jgi:aryl-alcohol dehydrogenase-like predicted oxidoreductase
VRSRLGGWTTFGAAVTDDDLIGRIIRRAFDAGVTFFDIADVYARGEAERAWGPCCGSCPATSS